MAAEWRIGERIENRWEIHKILRGGMGIVYVVYDHEFRRPLAAKTFKDELFTLDPGAADRFALEVRTWVNFDSHQNVVQARFVEKIRGKPFLFLEYVPGGDLSKWIGTPRLTEDLPQVLRFAIQFCDGMNHALSKGIQAHRDIKPQNCLVTQDRILKVTDFGLAKVFDDTPADEAHAAASVGGLAIHLSETGKSAGTCTHMAPEQFADAKHVDVRADIYSFGVMLFQMVTGRLPFVSRTWEGLKQLHSKAPPPPLESGQPSLDSIMRKCLAKAAAERYPGFGTLREELASIYERMTKQPAPKPVLGRELEASELCNKGNALVDLGRGEEGLACYDRALAIDPLDALVWYNKGVALGSLGRSEEALACYDRALAINPQVAEFWGSKGMALGSLGRHKDALACYERALAVDSQWAEAWYMKGRVLRSLGGREEALTCFERALALKPECAEAWCGKGAVLAGSARHKEALACYDRTLALNPQDAEAWFGKGVALATEARRAREAIEAIASLEQAQRLGHPNAAQAIAIIRKGLDTAG